MKICKLGQLSHEGIIDKCKIVTLGKGNKKEVKGIYVEDYIIRTIVDEKDVHVHLVTKNKKSGKINAIWHRNMGIDLTGNYEEAGSFITTESIKGLKSSNISGKMKKNFNYKFTFTIEEYDREYIENYVYDFLKNNNYYNYIVLDDLIMNEEKSDIVSINLPKRDPIYGIKYNLGVDTLDDNFFKARYNMDDIHSCIKYEVFKDRNGQLVISAPLYWMRCDNTKYQYSILIGDIIPMIGFHLTSRTIQDDYIQKVEDPEICKNVREEFRNYLITNT